MDFLLQEIHREVNTVSAKANDAEISQRVVEIKSELEKIRNRCKISNDFVYEKGFGFEHEMKEKGLGLIFIISAPSGTGRPHWSKRSSNRCWVFNSLYPLRRVYPDPMRRRGRTITSFPFRLSEDVEGNEFLEWAEVLKNRYGTLVLI